MLVGVLLGIVVLCCPVVFAGLDCFDWFCLFFAVYVCLLLLFTVRCLACWLMWCLLFVDCYLYYYFGYWFLLFACLGLCYLSVVLFGFCVFCCCLVGVYCFVCIC